MQVEEIADQWAFAASALGMPPPAPARALRRTFGCAWSRSSRLAQLTTPPRPGAKIKSDGVNDVTYLVLDVVEEAARILRELGTPCLIHQPRYSMFDRWIEGGLLDVLVEEGIGCIVFSPLAQGQLTDRYLNGIPSGARATKTERVWLTPDDVHASLVKVQRLNAIAQQRGQKLSQMALAWVLRQPAVTSALIGASSIAQIDDAVGTIKNLSFTNDELDKIEKILKGN